MTPFLKIATDLVDDCLQDYRIQSGMRMGLMSRIAKALREQHKAGMLRAADLCEESDDYSYEDDWGRGRSSGCLTCMEVIRAEAEKEELK